MVTKVQKWGNSQGLRLSKDLLSDAGIAVGDEVQVTAHRGTLVVTPRRRVRGGHDLRELTRRIPKGTERTNWTGGPLADARSGRWPTMSPGRETSLLTSNAGVVPPW